MSFRVARLIDGDICVDKDNQQDSAPTVSEATSGSGVSAGSDKNVDICDSETGRGKKQLPSHVAVRGGGAAGDRSKDFNSRKKGGGAQTTTNSSAAAILIAVEFLLDQQRAFLPPSKLRPFQVRTVRSVGRVN